VTPVKAGQCRVNAAGDRCYITNTTADVAFYVVLVVDSDGDVQAHAPECESLSVVERWPLTVAP
jgi:hypothetical protein